MANKRKKYSAQFKLERVLEAIKGDNVTEVSRKYDVGANMICNWKKQLLNQGSTVFSNSPDKEKNQLKSKINRLEQMIGKKEIELNVLKNFSDFYESQNTT
ncbi:MAG: transposase [Nanoarchaeota archaeon]|nr:transposase [Nanoarchaeota archaeon]